MSEANEPAGPLEEPGEFGHLNRAAQLGETPAAMEVAATIHEQLGPTIANLTGQMADHAITSLEVFKGMLEQNGQDPAPDADQQLELASLLAITSGALSEATAPGKSLVFEKRDEFDAGTILAHVGSLLARGRTEEASAVLVQRQPDQSGELAAQHRLVADYVIKSTRASLDETPPESVDHHLIVNHGRYMWLAGEIDRFFGGIEHIREQTYYVTPHCPEDPIPAAIDQERTTTPDTQWAQFVAARAIPRLYTEWALQRLLDGNPTDMDTLEVPKDEIFTIGERVYGKRGVSIRRTETLRGTEQRIGTTYRITYDDKLRPDDRILIRFSTAAGSVIDPRREVLTSATADVMRYTGTRSDQPILDNMLFYGELDEARARQRLDELRARSIGAIVGKIEDWVRWRREFKRWKQEAGIDWPDELPGAADLQQAQKILDTIASRQR